MSSSVPLIQRFLYISRLAADAPPDAVSQILRQSRERNRANVISGALVFDGERFCQLLEGEPQVVRHLVDRIAGDRRHRGMQVLLDTVQSTPRLLGQWHSGYGDPETLDIVEHPVDSGLTGDQTMGERQLEAFLSILPGCDMSL